MGESLQPCSNIGPSSRFVGLSSSLGTLDRSFGLIEGIVGKLVRTSGLCSRVSGQTVGGIDLQLHLIHRLMKCLIAGVQGLSSEAISPSNLRPLKSRKDGVNAQDDQADYSRAKFGVFPPVAGLILGWGACGWGVWRLRRGKGWRNFTFGATMIVGRFTMACVCGFMFITIIS